MLRLLSLVFMCLCTCDAFKILVVSPVPGKSHGILGDAVVRHLLEAGHEVTYISGFARKIPHPKLTHVHSTSNSKSFNEDTLNVKAIMDKEINMKDFDFVHQMLMNVSIATMTDDDVQALLKNPSKKFDAVIAEWLFSDVYATISAIYDCPLIWLSTVEPHWQVMRLIDEVLNPACNGDIYSDLSATYGFIDRVDQLWAQITGNLRLRRYLEQEKDIYEKNIVPILKSHGKPVPDYEDLVFNASLMLGNSHVSLGLATTLPEVYKPVGGYHVDAKPSPLPEDLQKLLDNAKNGLIYFSLGSNLKSKDIPDNLKKGFLKVFSGLKQTVLWKLEEAIPDLPKNVHIVKWAPQQSILAHPNCILFITHGGLLSTTETVHYGKPMIGIPVFADQFINVRRAVEKGYGRRVDLSYTMDADLKVQIEEILRNPEYAQKAKEFSFIYHDRLATPGQELVHWTEHVIKTKGASYLRSPARLVPWYQKIYLDLFALIIAGVTLVVLGLVKFLGSFTKVSKSKGKRKMQ